MSAVNIYWRDRLAAKAILYTPEFWKVGINVRPNLVDLTSKWPHMVSRSVLYSDYLRWFAKEYLLPFQMEEGFQTPEDRLPKPADELEFFCTLAPWLYVLGKKEQVRLRLVPVQEQFEGEWVETKKNRYFVRLCEWEIHVAAFELFTGTIVDQKLTYYDPAAAQRIVEAAAKYKASRGLEGA